MFPASWEKTRGTLAIAKSSTLKSHWYNLLHFQQLREEDKGGDAKLVETVNFFGKAWETPGSSLKQYDFLDDGGLSSLTTMGSCFEMKPFLQCQCSQSVEVSKVWQCFARSFWLGLSDEGLKSLPSRFGGFVFAFEGPSFLTGASPVPAFFSPQYDQHESTVMRFVKDCLLYRAGLHNIMLHMLFVQALPMQSSEPKKAPSVKSVKAPETVEPHLVHLVHVFGQVRKNRTLNQTCRTDPSKLSSHMQPHPWNEDCS